MEALFANCCAHSKENLLEMARKTRSSSSGHWRYFVVCLTLIVLIGPGELFSGKNVPLAICTFIFDAILLGVFYASPYISATRQYERRLELYHGESKAVTEYYDEHFLLKDPQSGGELTLQYDRITKVLETKHLLLLRLPQNLVLLLAKDGFTVGTKDEFVRFLRGKCPRAKFKVRN